MNSVNGPPSITTVVPAGGASAAIDFQEDKTIQIDSSPYCYELVKHTMVSTPEVVEEDTDRRSTCER